MTASSSVAARGAPAVRPERRFGWAWLGVVPFLVFAFAFLVLPSIYLLINSFQDNSGQLTVANYARLSEPNLADAYFASIEISPEAA